jgi:hypothetical protein
MAARSPGSGGETFHRHCRHATERDLAAADEDVDDGAEDIPHELIPP